jgi:hypothetical protein
MKKRNHLNMDTVHLITLHSDDDTHTSVQYTKKRKG